MNNRIYVATFSNNAIEEIRDNNLNIELNHLCISENLDDVNMNKTLQDIRKDINESAANNVIAHGPFTEIIPASIDHLIVDVGLMRMNQAYEACKAVNVKSMVVHSGHMPLLYFDSWHIEKSVYFWDRFLEDKEDFTIYIENVFEDNPKVMKDLIMAIDKPNAKICLDIGHANAMQRSNIEIEDWIEILGESIGHFHIHNNDGSDDQHRELADGSIDMKNIFKAAEKYCNDNVTFTIESKNCKDSIKWLRDNEYIK